MHLRGGFLSRTIRFSIILHHKHYIITIYYKFLLYAACIQKYLNDIEKCFSKIIMQRYFNKNNTGPWKYRTPSMLQLILPSSKGVKKIDYSFARHLDNINNLFILTCIRMFLRISIFESLSFLRRTLGINHICVWRNAAVSEKSWFAIFPIFDEIIFYFLIHHCIFFQICWDFK